MVLNGELELHLALSQFTFSDTSLVINGERRNYLDRSSKQKLTNSLLVVIWPSLSWKCCSLFSHTSRENPDCGNRSQVLGCGFIKVPLSPCEHLFTIFL